MKLYKSQNEYDTEAYTNGNAALVVGAPVKLSSGKLVADAAAPTHIALEAAAANEANILVHPIRKDEQYSAILSASGASLNVGDAVTLTTAGKATATTTNGIFRIEEFLDATKAAGTVVVGKFI